MILIKIDSLSTKELRNIAEQEGLDGYESLSREELIDELQDFYGDDEDFVPGGDVNRRFLCGITDYRGIDQDVQELPGVEELPLDYPSTDIHLLYKNPSWGYCYWSVSPQDMMKLQERNITELILLVSVRTFKGTEEFEVPVSIEDTDWNIGLPVHGGECSVALVVRENGHLLELAHSNEISLVKSYWLEHPKEMLENEQLFKVYLSMITTKEGQLAESPVVYDIISTYHKEDLNRWHK